MGNWQAMLFSANGRIRRSQYWLWSIGSAIVIGIVVQILLTVLGVQQAMQQALMNGGKFPAMFWIIELVALVPSLWIGLCLQIKRWHDRDKSGWWVLISFVPIIGFFWWLIECGFLDGTQGPNKFGPSPKGLG